ncbi:hypothetical protein [Mycolicibacterium sp. HK-90]|uniref:hypothetical protein n=1 Tax=Mycolicibacterium sp. HK-90 TaxID=3056937 RepID=UPI002659A158|nr:hypothetical protein [Mycolicibacterium sp. HK-90]WKG03327.1 hypothetical protein QU592_29830 [Mycolicibacterium sp. HK-90]
MTAVRTDHAAALRGTAVGSLTATLAVAAHGVAGGVMPSGAVAAQLVVLALTLGAVAATVARANRATALWALLGTGQLLAHMLLATAGHAHDARPPLVMLVAHLVAVTVGASLIASGARLWAALSRVVRAAVRAVRGTPVTTLAVATSGADQPLHSALLLAASVSHRGPPVGAAA